MGRVWTATTAAAMAAALAGAAGAAEQTVTYPSGDEKATALLVTPEGKGPFPAVVVIHEWWGLDEWVKDQARALAREGYVALAVDLYRGKVTSDAKMAHQLMSGLPQDRAVRDLRAGVSWLSARDDVRDGKVGVIGWCMGGKYAMLLATEEPKLAAAVAYYGAPPTDPLAIARIEAPVLGNFGGADEGPSPAQVEAFEAAMKKAGKAVDIKVYEGAPHAFANPNNPWGGYRQEAAQDAWARSVAFLGRHLKGGGGEKKPPAAPPASASPAAR